MQILWKVKFLCPHQQQIAGGKVRRFETYPADSCRCVVAMPLHWKHVQLVWECRACPGTCVSCGSESMPLRDMFLHPLDLPAAPLFYPQLRIQLFLTIGFAYFKMPVRNASLKNSEKDLRQTQLSYESPEVYQVYPDSS